MAVKKSILVPLITLGCAAALVFVIRGYWNSWEGGWHEQKTDDAYVRANMTPMISRVSGKVKRIAVEDYQRVKYGDLLVELNDEGYQAGLSEAHAARKRRA